MFFQPLAALQEVPEWNYMEQVYSNYFFCLIIRQTITIHPHICNADVVLLKL